MPVSAPATALIIPALNEEPVIARMLAAIPPDLYRAVIVADNGSEDKTAEIAAGCGAIVVREPERGYGAACLAAIAALPPEIGIVVFQQADLSEDPEDARALLAPILAGAAELVIGSRTLGRADRGALLPHQEFGNRLATTLIRWIWGHRYTDLGPFRAITRPALERLRMRDRNYGWTVEMQVRALQERLRVAEVPVRSRVRAAGINKVSGDWRASLRAGQVILTTIARLAIRGA
jgi:glycosyltransferase involved in cell wall biosynthesis